jgi:hypothetical protein
MVIRATTIAISTGRTSITATTKGTFTAIDTTPMATTKGTSTAIDTTLTAATTKGIMVFPVLLGAFSRFAVTRVQFLSALATVFTATDKMALKTSAAGASVPTSEFF